MFRIRLIPRRETLFFLHVPKCAGTTFVEEVLRKRFPPQRLLIFYEHRTEDLIRRLQTMGSRQQRRIHCLAGHFAYGVHRFYTARPVLYLTVLRDPIERTISHYHQAWRRQDHYLHRAVRENNLSLREYVERRLSAELDNGQTRLIAGVGWGAPQGECPPTMLAAAKEHLDSFAVVGLTDMFDGFLQLVQRRFGWEIPAYQKRNVAETRMARQNLDPQTLAAIEAANQSDLDLYRYAQGLFAAQWQRLFPEQPLAIGSDN